MPLKHKLDVHNPEFWDESSLLQEERRQFDVCHGCRLCFNFCPAFPTLFDLTDSVDGEFKQITRDDLRPVEDQCYQCKLCYIRCPYTPPHELNLDVPRLFARARLVNAKKEGVGIREHLLANTDLVGKFGSMTAPMANMGNGVRPIRFVMEKVAGVHRDATLPKFASRTFASWWRRNGAKLNAKVSAEAKKVAFFYTCTLNYNDPAIAIASVEVLAHNNIRVQVGEQQCCGMPYLDVGALEQTEKKLKFNVEHLAKLVREGYDVIAPQPTCGYMLKKEYPLLDESAEAKLVAEHTFDIAEYLWKLRPSGGLKTDFRNKIGKIAYHVPCHTRAQFMGQKSADLMELIPGAEVERIEKCSAHDGTWGVKKASHKVSLHYGQKLFADMKESEADLYVSDCPLAANQVQHGTGKRPVHPMQVLKTAYGI